MAKVSFTKTEASVLLDLVRGVAASLVVLDHWRNLLFVDYRDLQAHKLVMLLPYLLSSAGHQAVIVFFVLSGYLISGSVFRMLDRDAWSWTTYLTHRLTRLWIVLIPGLLLCLACDWTGIHSGVAPMLYRGLVGNHLIDNVPALLTPRIFLGNMFFLQQLHVPMFGSDKSLWSLANEFWYYMLFPLGLFAVRRGTPLRTRLISVGLFVLVVILIGTIATLEFPIWLAGTLLCFMPIPRLSGTVRLLASAVYVAMLFILQRQTIVHLHWMLVDYLLTLSTFLYLWILLSATAEARPSPGAAVSRGLSRFSYTLYVVHMPFVLLLTAFAAHNTRWVPDTRHIVEGLGLLAVTFAYAYGVAAATEFHTDRWRGWIERRLGLTQRSRVAVKS